MIRETNSLLPLLTIAALAATVTTPADASVSIALSIDDVAKASSAVARVVPIAETSAWEGGRIVTTTRLRVDRLVAGSISGSEVDVRTLGGRVGDVGQIVEGEPHFARDTTSLVFLARREGEATFQIAGRAQGQLIVARSSNAREVVRVLPMGALFPKRGMQAPPMTALDGRDANEVTRDAALAWERTHAR